MRRIAIIGAGNVGGALGRAWARAGHDVIFGVREPTTAKAEALRAAGPNVTVADVAAAAGGAPVVVLATPWAAAEAALRGAGDLREKILVDCTNPLKLTPGIGLELALGYADSGAEQVARWAPAARVVKAFNTYGFENFAESAYPNAAGLRPLMFLAGDDQEAKAGVGGLAADIGFEPFDAGTLRAARELEPLAMLWIRLATTGTRSANFTWACLRR